MRFRRASLTILLLSVAAFSTSSVHTSRLLIGHQEKRPLSMNKRPAYAQDTALRLPNENPPRKLSVTADGSKNPELISDSRAYIHLLLATTGTAERDVSRREAILTRAGLSRTDRDAYASAVADLAIELPAAAAQRMAAIRNERAGDYENARLQEREALERARLRLDTALTPLGRFNLDVYVQQHVKPGIVVYGGPMHAGH